LHHHIAHGLLHRRVLQQQPHQRDVQGAAGQQGRGRHALARQRHGGGPLQHRDKRSRG
jgi:hypothetical protein